MTTDFRRLRERESVAVRIARAGEKDFIPFKINLDLYTWQMATESGAEITQSTVFGRVRVREKGTAKFHSG